jgi:hypothetical protein
MFGSCYGVIIHRFSEIASLRGAPMGRSLIATATSQNTSFTLMRSTAMKCRHLLFSAALVLSTAAITTTVVSQDKGKGEPPMTPEMQAAMQKWEAFMTPGEAHKILHKKVGKWNCIMKHWMDPAAPPMESTYTANVTNVYEGRYIHEVVEGEGMMPGQTFLGQSFVGYDNMKKKYAWVWIDNMGTGFMNAEGAYDAASKTFKYTFEHPDPEQGKYCKGRSVEKWVTDDQYVMEMYGTDKAGKEIKMMESTCNRAK